MLRLLVVVALFSWAQGATGLHVSVAAGYPFETHNVVTEDGYILALHRIPHGRKSRPGPRKVVFLMHGVTFGSNTFMYAGPKYAIAYILADAGFDVWMGNARGNGYSRRHVCLDPDADKMKFFNYTYEHIAMYDMPAMFDHVLNETGEEKMHYVGYSQGGSVFYALNSLSSAYHSKIATAHLLAGIGYQGSLPNTNMRLVSTSVDVLYSVALLSGEVEVAPSKFSTAMVEILVGAKTPSEFIVGAAVRQLLHYVQNMRDKRFCRWNYGTVGNVEEYGSAVPPAYNLSNIDVDVTVHYSLGDVTQSEADALAMVKAMPRAIARKVPSDNFNHIDYLSRKDAKELFINYIIDSMKKS